MLKMKGAFVEMCCKFFPAAKPPSPRPDTQPFVLPLWLSAETVRSRFSPSVSFKLEFPLFGSSRLPSGFFLKHINCVN